jgi:hypothetical protein
MRTEPEFMSAAGGASARCGNALLIVGRHKNLRENGLNEKLAAVYRGVFALSKTESKLNPSVESVTALLVKQSPPCTSTRGGSNQGSGIKVKSFHHGDTARSKSKNRFFVFRRAAVPPW